MKAFKFAVGDEVTWQAKDQTWYGVILSRTRNKEQNFYGVQYAGDRQQTLIAENELQEVKYVFQK